MLQSKLQPRSQRFSIAGIHYSFGLVDVSAKSFTRRRAAATPRICLAMESLKSFGRASACSRLFQDSAVRSTVSTVIFHSGLAGMRTASAKRRIWPGVISERLRLSPKAACRHRSVHCNLDYFLFTDCPGVGALITISAFIGTNPTDD